MKLADLVAVSCFAASAVLAAECSVACPLILVPVCASNGKTYANECEFNSFKCTTNDSELVIAKTGACASSDGTRSSESSGNPECSKAFACMDVDEPVCGSDGVTYFNSCVLQKAQCLDTTISKVSDGECKNESTTSNSTTAPPDASSGSGSTVCSKTCTKEIEFVCGSDGVTYTNECLLETEKECVSPTLTKSKNGECSSSSTAGSSSALATEAPPPTALPSSNAFDLRADGITAFACCVIAASALG